MKKLIALFLFIAMLFSLASCGEPAPEPPATDDTPKDEGFEQGYLFCHEAELCNPWEFTYSERQYDIIAYRSKVKSFDRSTLEDIELEISYGTFSDALKPYAKVQSIPRFRIVAIPTYGNGEPVTIATHEEQLISEKYSYTKDGEALKPFKNELHGWENKFNNRETIFIPSSLFSGEQFGSISLWVIGENVLDNNQQVYKYGEDIFYTVSGNTVTLCTDDEFFRYIDELWVSEKRNEPLVSISFPEYANLSPSGAMVLRPISASFDKKARDSVDLIVQLWNTNLYYYQDIDCPSFDISVYHRNDDTYTKLLTVEEQLFSEKQGCGLYFPYINTTESRCQSVKRVCKSYYLVSVPTEVFNSADYGTLLITLTDIPEVKNVGYGASLKYLVNDNIITMCVYDTYQHDSYFYRSYKWTIEEN
ncbi:MAG: hypothetical protein IJY24_03240 [Clostridia bacterium]|nr:hypothetical protein [Clostridia bacterium]